MEVRKVTEGEKSCVAKEELMSITFPGKQQLYKRFSLTTRVLANAKMAAVEEVYGRVGDE